MTVRAAHLIADLMTRLDEHGTETLDDDATIGIRSQIRELHHQIVRIAARALVSDDLLRAVHALRAAWAAMEYAATARVQEPLMSALRQYGLALMRFDAALPW